MLSVPWQDAHLYSVEVNLKCWYRKKNFRIFTGPQCNEIERRLATVTAGVVVVTTNLYGLDLCWSVDCWKAATSTKSSWPYQKRELRLKSGPSTDSIDQTLHFGDRFSIILCQLSPIDCLRPIGRWIYKSMYCYFISVATTYINFYHNFAQYEWQTLVLTKSSGQNISFNTKWRVLKQMTNRRINKLNSYPVFLSAIWSIVNLPKSDSLVLFNCNY